LADGVHASNPQLHGAAWRRTLRVGSDAQGRCFTCGCKQLYDELGNPKNMTERYFVEAGQTAATGKAGTVEAKRRMLELDKPKEQ
jgi:hypothetical protein